MSQLSVGFARVNTTPMMGIGVAGYFQARLAEGVLDELEINALALDCAGVRAVLLSVDNCGLKKDFADRYRKYTAENAGISLEAIFIHSTHTHTGPLLEPGSALAQEYDQMLCHRASDAARFALEDLKSSRMGYAVGQAPHIAFIRRYRMKDGSIRTNPGVNNPDILEPIGAADERVNVLRFDQEDGRSLVLVNFGCHPDVVGGCRISADWPGFLRRTAEQALGNTRCIFFNGAEGDVNHVNVHPAGGDGNDMFHDFGDVDRGYGHARHMGRVVTGAVL